MTRRPPYCGGKRPEGARRPVRATRQPANWSLWGALAVGLAVFSAFSLPVPARAVAQPVAETLPAGPAPLVPGQPIPDVEPVKICPAAHDLCVESQGQGDYDVQAGVAELRGDVRGYLRSHDLAFNSERLKAVRASAGAPRRVELYGTVRMTEPGRRIAADNAVLEDDLATASGKVRVEQQGQWIEGDQVVVEHETQRVTVSGKPDEPMTMLVAEQSAEAPTKGFTPAQAAATGTAPATAAGSAPAAASTSLGDGTQAWAQRAVMEEDGRQLQLTGAVHVKVPAKQITLDAESVTLQFSEEGTVTGFTARGNVIIVQPGRRLTSDSARSQNRMQTILLLGKARMQQEGQFDLNSDRMEVFVDAKRGTVRSEDRQKPMNLSLDVNAARGWKLDASRMSKLRDQGVPDPVLKKLEPLQGRSFTTQPAFEQAVGDRLTPEESDRHLAAISTQARP